LTETWLTSDDQAATRAITPDGYQLHHVPRSGRKGGGVAFLCLDSYKVVVQPPHHASSFESIELLVTVASISIRLIVLYRIPPS